MENQFPHHECEIAQSEAANGVQFVKYWMHNNMVTVNGQKMGKSLNNFINLKELFAGEHETLSRAYDPLAVRQLILQSHYRSPIDFSDAGLTAAQSGYDKITEGVVALRKAGANAAEGDAEANVEKELENMKDKFENAMNEDFNTSVGLSVIFELVKLSNKLVEGGKASKGSLQAVDGLFRRLGGDVLGIVKDEYAAAGEGDEELLDHLIGDMIYQRKEAKANKDYAAADAIRDKLASLGILLEDKPGGECTWRRK